MPKIELDKVLDILSKHGIEETVMEEVKSKVEDETPSDASDEKPVEEVDTASDVTPVEGEGEIPTEEEPKPAEDDVPAEDTPVDVPSEPEAPAELEGDAAPVDSGLPEGSTEVDLSGDVPADVAPVEEEPAPVEPQPDYQAMYEETKKVCDGLEARVNALEEALRKGGILSDEKPSGEYGVDDPTNIHSSGDEEISMDDVLAEINRKR